MDEREERVKWAKLGKAGELIAAVVAASVANSRQF